MIRSMIIIKIIKIIIEINDNNNVLSSIVSEVNKTVFFFINIISA